MSFPPMFASLFSLSCQKEANRRGDRLIVIVAGDFQDKKGPVAGTLVGNKYAFYVAST
jgi:hypothetical protein